MSVRVLVAGNGRDVPKDGDHVSFHLAGRTNGEEPFIDEKSSFDVGMQLPGSTRLTELWSEGFKLMSLGEKARWWIPGKLRTGDYPYRDGGAPDLTYDIELLDIARAPETPNDLRSPPPTAKRTSSGLVYRVLEPGTGKSHPRAHSFVTVHEYTWTTEGQLLVSPSLTDSVARGEPSSYWLDRQMLGLTEGIQLMVVGEKARFWIPAALASSDKPGSKALVVDVELLKIE